MNGNTKIALDRIDLERDVEATLIRATHDLLPEEITENYLADWILSFDSLGKDKSNWGRYTKEDESVEVLVSATIESSLNPNISFYFGTLFHIGRQWQVSNYAQTSIENALKEDNFAETIRRNTGLFRETLSELDIDASAGGDIVSSLMQEALEFAKKQHQVKIAVAKRYWTLWQHEVKDLRQLVDGCTEEYNQSAYWQGRDEMFSLPGISTLTQFSYKVKPLFRQLFDDGVSFKEVSTFHDPNRLDFSNLLPLVIAAMRDERSRYEWHRLLGAFARVFAAQTELLRAQRIEPTTQKVESHLFRLFEDNDPFEKYHVLGCPPDMLLLQLWTKCQLPDETVFHYAKSWKASLEKSSPDWYGSLEFKQELDKEDMRSFAISADSTIKLGWISEKRQTGQTDAEHIQYLFEKKWIMGMVNSAVGPTRDKKVGQKWTLPHLTEVISGVIDVLSKHGYALTLPDNTRLRNLWEKSSTSTWYESIDW